MGLNPFVSDGLCCVKGCNNPIRSMHFCSMRYGRWERYGHPLGDNAKRYATGIRIYKPKMKERWAWRAMIDRCSNPNAKNYPRYGARGISVCERWMDFITLWQAVRGKSWKDVQINGN